MAAPKEMNSDSISARYVLMQHREGVSLTLNIFVGEEPRALVEEYEMLLEQIAKFPGYALRGKDKDSEYERGRRAGAASRGRR